MLNLNTLNNQWIKKIKSEIRKYFEMNKNENTTYPKLWNAARAELKGKLQLQKPTVKKKTLSSMAQLYLTLLKEREKEVQTKP